MSKIVALILLILPLHILSAEDFDLFEPKEKADPALFDNLRHHKLRATYCAYPRINERSGIGYEYFFTKKWALFSEALYKNSITQFGNGERLETNFGATYRFTKRVSSLVFLGSTGISLNNDYNNENGDNKGFRINQLFIKFTGEYTLKNGFGLEYGLVGKLSLEPEFDENEAHHFFSLVYLF